MPRTSLVVALLLGTSPAATEPLGERPHSAVTLELHRSPGAAGCPGPEVLREQVRKRLGYDLFQAGAPHHLALAIDRTKGGYRVVGALRDHDGAIVYTPETLVEPGCAALMTNLAILLAVHFTQARSASPAVPPAAPAPVVPRPPLPRPPLPRPPLPRPPLPRPAPPESVRLQFGLTTTLALALAPAVVVGPAWFVGARVANASFALEGRALFAPPVHVGGATIVSSVVAGSAAACLHSGALFGCARVELGGLHFTSTTDLRFEPTTPVLAGFGARAGAEWPIARGVSVRGYADLMTLATPTKLWRAQDNRLVWTSSLLSPSAGVGIATSF